MGPYSHYVIANYIEDRLKPTDAQAYYWGSVAPDIRYLLPEMKRSETHLSTQVLQASMVQYPDLRDFLHGYLVHCLCDELDLLQIIQHKFPFNLQKNALSKRQGAVILEFFNILRVKTPGIPLSGVNNTFLKTLGISDQEAVHFSGEANRYVTTPSLKSTVALYQGLGFTKNDLLEKYRMAATSFQKNWFQKNLILFGMQVGKVNEDIASSVKEMFLGILG